jgi:hypothetical protein
MAVDLRRGACRNSMAAAACGSKRKRVSLSISSRNRRRGEGILDRRLVPKDRLRPPPSADGETFLSSRNSRLWLEKDFALSDGRRTLLSSTCASPSGFSVAPRCDADAFAPNELAGFRMPGAGTGTGSSYDGDLANEGGAE